MFTVLHTPWLTGLDSKALVDNAIHLATGRPRSPDSQMGCVGQDGPEQTRRVSRGLAIGGCRNYECLCHFQVYGYVGG
jgi:hypothetical protein